MHRTLNLSILVIVSMVKFNVQNMKNLDFSFLYNCLGVPVAAGIFYPLPRLLLTSMVAAIAMSLSSLFVVLNALRLSLRVQFTFACMYMQKRVSVFISA